MRRGELWWVERPRQKRRQYLILSRSRVVDALSAVIAVPMTSTVRSIPREVKLRPGDGMPKGCALNLDNLDLVKKIHFRERICTLAPVRLEQVCAALAVAVDAPAALQSEAFRETP